MAKEIKSVETKDKIEYSGILDKGFGIVAQRVMIDKSLSVEAKAIYSFLCTFTNSKKTCFPSIEYQFECLNMSKKRYLKHRDQLEAAGYIKITKTRQVVTYTDDTKKEFRDNNVYTIVMDFKEIELLKEEYLNKINKKPKKQVSKVSKRVIKNEADTSESIEDTDVALGSRFDHLQNDHLQNDYPNNTTTNNTTTNNTSNNSSSKDEEEKTDIDLLLAYTSKNNYKLSRKNGIKLLEVYPLDKIKQAILKALSTNNFKAGEIKNYMAYLLTVLTDQTKDKIVNINTGKSNKSTFKAGNEGYEDINDTDETFGWDDNPDTKMDYSKIDDKELLDRLKNI